MPIHDEDKGNNQAKEAFAKAGLGSNQPGSPASDDQGRRRRSSNDLTAAGINTHYRRSMSRAPTSQATIEFEKAFTKSLEENLRTEADYPVVYAIKSIDSTDSQDVGISCILACASFSSNNKKTMIVFTMLVEGSIDSMPITEVQVAGQNKPVEIQLTAGDYAVQGLWSAIETKLRGIYGPEYEILPAGNFTLPRTVNPEKDVFVIREALFNAVGALDTFIERNFEIGAEPLTVQVVTNKATTQIVMDLNDMPETSPVGLPTRNDVSMTLRSTVRSTAVGVPDKVINVVRLTGFVNLAYTLPPAATQANQRPDTRRFTPQFVLTDLSSETNLITLETQLLALCMAPLLDYNDQYLAPLMPNATQRNPGRDFGAVGYEVNLSGQENGQPVGKEDLKQMSTAEIFTMAKMSMFPDLHVSMLIDESGPLTWMNTVFMDAAQPNNQAAYEAVVKAADNLTGGIFSQVFGGGPLTSLTGTRLHLGYYRDDNGDTRDLLDIDYLWMLNRCGAKNINTAYDFGDTLLGNDNPDKALADRWAIISRLVPSATLVSYGQIVDINPDFLVALIQAVKRAGLPLRANNSLVDFQNARGRSSYHSSAGLNSSLISATLNQGGGDQHRGRATYGGSGFNQWGRRR